MPSSSRASHYQRFIPCEEVQDVAAWEFAPVDDAARRQAQAARAAPAAPEWDSARVEQLRQQAHQAGWAEGHAAGTEQTRLALQAELQALTQAQAERVTALLASAQAELERLEHALADQMLELACDLARQVVRRELAQPLEPLRAVVREALALACADARVATLRLHPEDLALLQSDPTLGPAGLELQLLSDPALSPGGCVLENRTGSVDARLEQRWARAVANLGLQSDWLPAGAHHD